MFVQVSLMDTRVPADGLLGLVGAVDLFQGWTGDVTSTNTTFRVLMVGDKRVEAVWATDYTMPVLGLGLILVIILVAALIVAKRKRPQVQVRVLYPTSGHSSYFVGQYQR
jgi:NADH:ubiquinone oxidoreductase subunit 6 (subunit J)